MPSNTQNISQTVELVDLKRVALDIPRWLHRDAKVSAVLSGVDLRQFIADAILAHIHEQRAASTPSDGV